MQFPHSTICLLTKMLNDGTEFDYCGEHLSNIYKEARGLSKKEKTDFQEALLKRDISI